MELQQQAEGFRKQGLSVASLTYDSAAVLKDFARRKGITYPMLSDPESRVIQAFGILNTSVEPGPARGIPHPGTYVIDERGFVKAKYFEDDFRERATPASVLTHIFGASGVESTSVETPHLKLTWSASDANLQPGGRTALILGIELKPGMHVYAPGVEGGYIPIDWQVPGSTAWQAHAAEMPPSRKLRLEAIKETVPVYEGKLRLVRDVTISQEQALRAVMTPERALRVTGSFRYQACDARECYPPRSVPLAWTFRVGQLDRQRAPAELQRK